MNFDLDNDQQQLQDSLARLLQTKVPFEQRRQLVACEPAWDTTLWPALGELGATALTLPKAYGGFAQRPIALLPVLQALGHSLAVQPFLATAVLAATAIEQAGSDAQKGKYLPLIAQGNCVAAFAHGKQPVLFGADADVIVVATRDGNDSRLCLVDTRDPGVRITRTRLIDDTPAVDLDLREARMEPLPGDGPAAVRATLDAGLAVACGEALGVAERAYDLTVDYVQTRQQFGCAIGSNQAVRHRIAEMRVALDMLRSAAMMSLLALELEDAEQRARELSRAKMLVSRHGTFVAQQAIQLHGGIGMTIEYAAGHCLRRLTVLEFLFGDGPSHAARLGAAIVASDDGDIARAA